jgi:hypothetical protein
MGKPKPFRLSPVISGCFGGPTGEQDPVRHHHGGVVTSRADLGGKEGWELQGSARSTAGVIARAQQQPHGRHPWETDALRRAVPAPTRSANGELPVQVCSVDGCEQPMQARRLCSKHYRRLMRHGDPLGRTWPGPQNPPEARRRPTGPSSRPVTACGLVVPSPAIRLRARWRTTASHRYGHGDDPGPGCRAPSFGNHMDIASSQCP